MRGCPLNACAPQTHVPPTFWMVPTPLHLSFSKLIDWLIDWLIDHGTDSPLIVWFPISCLVNYIWFTEVDRSIIPRFTTFKQLPRRKATSCMSTQSMWRCCMPCTSCCGLYPQLLRRVFCEFSPQWRSSKLRQRSTWYVREFYNHYGVGNAKNPSHFWRVKCCLWQGFRKIRKFNRSHKNSRKWNIKLQ